MQTDTRCDFAGRKSRLKYEFQMGRIDASAVLADSNLNFAPAVTFHAKGVGRISSLFGTAANYHSVGVGKRRPLFGTAYKY
jgi:hypothetical protein